MSRGSRRDTGSGGPDSGTGGPPRPALRPGAGREPRPRPSRPSRPTGRAGRNLAAAFAVGGGLGAAVLATLLLWRPAFLVIVVAAVSAGVWEMVRAVHSGGARPPLTPLLAGGVVMTVLAWSGGLEALTLGLLGTVLATMAWRLATGPAGYHRDIGASTLILVYVPFLAGFAVLLASPPDGAWRVLITLVVVVATDTGGYVTGVFLGRHPLAPAVSPKKSWEGFAGSLVAAAAAGAACLGLSGAAWWAGAAFGAVVALAAVLGDLAESLLKRDLGIKDMGTLLPGHGGMMDRLDSILFAAPAAYLLLEIVVPAA